METTAPEVTDRTVMSKKRTITTRIRYLLEVG